MDCRHGLGAPEAWNPKTGTGGRWGTGGREREVSCVNVVNKKLSTKEPQIFHEMREVKTFSSLKAEREV